MSQRIITQLNQSFTCSVRLKNLGMEGRNTKLIRGCARDKFWIVWEKNCLANVYILFNLTGQREKGLFLAINKKKRKQKWNDQHNKSVSLGPSECLIPPCNMERGSATLEPELARISAYGVLDSVATSIERWFVLNSYDKISPPLPSDCARTIALKRGHLWSCRVCVFLQLRSRTSGSMTVNFCQFWLTRSCSDVETELDKSEPLPSRWHCVLVLKTNLSGQ